MIRPYDYNGKNETKDKSYCAGSGKLCSCKENIEKYKEYTELETLTSDIANDVVKRVTVYKDGGIEIELALRDELEKLLTCLETVDAAS